MIKFVINELEKFEIGNVDCWKMYMLRYSKKVLSEIAAITTKSVDKRKSSECYLKGSTVP